ncbi:TRIAP1/MDM35 family protein SCDLUD_004160 [Saccharomycodes ludwigii]|uniref:TRIAP1/MDM35 family protein n=1 Tax=Saccharomycodes ludwigii TaxID=36035 RepID=UPI001E847A60|nr:hypothetical protein SCDLUD_004160 [Saccharomycodes ludwigii]KAH3899861.1 hypothetical protein SCDLUD_004160 [Saccharomycodes ludwigii]
MSNKPTPCFEPSCTEYKIKYDNCFNKWYSEVFLNKKAEGGNDICTEEWKLYKSCIDKALENKPAIKKSIEKARLENPFEQESTQGKE